MALKPILVVMLALAPAAARADCETDAVRARSMIMASGPFHFDSQYGEGKAGRHLTGEVEPYEASHLVLEVAVGAEASNDWLELTSVGGRTWKKGAGGWSQPEGKIVFFTGIHYPASAL